MALELPGKVPSPVQHQFALLVVPHLKLRVEAGVHSVHPLLLLLFYLLILFLCLFFLLIIVVIVVVADPLHPPELVYFTVTRVLYKFSTLLEAGGVHVDIHLVEEALNHKDLSAAVHVPPLVESVVRLPYPELLRMFGRGLGHINQLACVAAPDEARLVEDFVVLDLLQVPRICQSLRL